MQELIGWLVFRMFIRLTVQELNGGLVFIMFNRLTVARVDWLVGFHNVY